MHQIGNSVPPQIGRILALSILNQVFSCKLPADLPLLHPNQSLKFRQRKRQLTKIYQSKAKEAIGNSTRKKSRSNRSHEYFAVLGSDFTWSVVDEKSGTLRVTWAIEGSDWVVNVFPVAKKKRTPDFSILVESNHVRPWSIDASTITLNGFDSSREVFVGLWKALESVLQQSGEKADLVQLAEYYQYVPRLKCRFVKCNETSLNWSVLKKVVAGIGTREIITTSRLSSCWDVDCNNLLDVAIWLRSYGYETRNNRTNPQIPLDSYLIPYAFPTLTPQSVQLRKQMEARDER
jgi:DNA (cytosine-5)-methyltransferase 1